jgi:hypothetical protein
LDDDIEELREGREEGENAWEEGLIGWWWFIDFVV